MIFKWIKDLKVKNEIITVVEEILWELFYHPEWEKYFQLLFKTQKPEEKKIDVSCFMY